MIHDIILPSRPKVISENGNQGIFEIDSLYPGYGITIGTSLRRVLLSSLPGSAVTSIKIDGVHHEFSTIPGVLEDMVTILLNIKKLRFRVNSEEPQTVELSAKGQKSFTAKDLTVPSTVDIINADEPILTLTGKDASIHIELIVERGLGYVPRELARKEKVEVGMMIMDALFSPVKKVNYEVEDMRVGDRTDYNRLRFTIDTDGSISPREAFLGAVTIVIKQFEALSRGFSEGEAMETFMDMPPAEMAGSLQTQDTDEETDLSKLRVEDLRLSSRTINALHEAGIKTVGGLLRKDTDSLSTIPGVGDKALQEIKRALGSMGLTLK
jgi:DNA-directed RNA polymerase subunit alpha